MQYTQIGDVFFYHYVGINEINFRGILHFTISVQFPTRYTPSPKPQFNIKMTSYQYRKYHCRDKTIWRPSYPHNGISYTDDIFILNQPPASVCSFRMYGLILEGIGDAVRRKFGDEIWEETRKKAGVPHHSFNMHKTYSETVIPRLAKAGSEVTGRPIDELMELCGYSFVAYVSPYGYDRVLRVLGRHVRDFLNGLDNLHEYLRFR